jgi:putative N-acetylmannosamine-6-phosphate epimerase
MTEDLQAQLEELGDKLRAAGVDFIFSTISGTTEHKVRTRINAKDDHHVLDMLHNIGVGWHSANHTPLIQRR